MNSNSFLQTLAMAKGKVQVQMYNTISAVRFYIAKIWRGVFMVCIMALPGVLLTLS